MELAKVPKEIALTIRSVAWLLGELEEEMVAEVTRTVVNEQFDYLNGETKNLSDEMRTTLSEEVEKNLSSIGTVATKVPEEKAGRLISY